MRLCEERIILVTADEVGAALQKAKVYGREQEFEAKSEAGTPLHFEFVGVMDLLELGIEAKPEEVWYNISVRKLPYERREKWIPKESELTAIRSEKLGGKMGIKRGH